MVIMGLFITATALAGGYLALTRGDLPSIMYGRFRRKAPELPPIRIPRAGLVRWKTWNAGLLREAKKSDRLILLHLSNTWSRASHLMEETVYADAEVAAWLESSVLPVRVDGLERPDLARRYLSGGWPTTALLLPTGEIMASGTYMTTPQFLTWAKTLEKSFRTRRGGVAEAAARTSESRAADEKTRAHKGRVPRADEALGAAKAALESQWDESSQGFGKGARFPYFKRIENLISLGEKETARRAWGGAANLEDPVWGGFYRYAAGPGWQKPAYEKLLSDQADALAAAFDPEAARRILSYVRTFLSDPEGGYYAGQDCEAALADGSISEGSYYFSLPDEKRRALGLPKADRRIFADLNGRMISAALTAPESSPEDRAFALKSLERYFAQGALRGGVVVRHRLGGPWDGLPEDYLSLAEASLSAYAATRERRQWDRALTLMKAAESQYASPWGPLYDRPALGELPAGLDRALSPELNARALALYQRFMRLLPAGAGERKAMKEKSFELASWLAPRSGELDPAAWALLARDQSAVMDAP